MSPTGAKEWQEYLSGLENPAAPATQDELRAAEQRLGTTLPPSLRTLLASANGTPEVHSTTELRWTDDPGHDLVDAWSSFEEIIELIARCLVVGDRGDGRYGLLDPTLTDQDGEWLAYDWAAGDGEIPRPFPSFSALVLAWSERDHQPAGSGRPSS